MVKAVFNVFAEYIDGSRNSNNPFYQLEQRSDDVWRRLGLGGLALGYPNLSDVADRVVLETQKNAVDNGNRVILLISNPFEDTQKYLGTNHNGTVIRIDEQGEERLVQLYRTINEREFMELRDKIKKGYKK